MKKLSLFFILVAICSCSKNASESVEQSVSASDDFKSYRLDTGLPEERFADMIESVEVVRLEETDNSLLTYVHSINQTDKELVFPSGSESDIFVFDLNGNFKRKINRKGEGPEEYGSITDMWLESDTVVLYSRNQATVSRYDLEGKFIRAEKLPVFPAHIYGYDKGYAMDMNYSPINDTLLYRYATIDPDLKVNAMYFPVKTRMPIGLYLSNNSVAPYKEGVTLFRMMSDTVYYLNKNGLEPLIHFDLGKDWYWADGTKVTQDFVQIMQSTEKVWTINIKLHRNHIWVSTYTGFAEGIISPSFLIDRATGIVHHMDMRKEDNTNGVAIPLDWDGEQMVYTIQSTDIAAFLSELDESRIHFREGTTLEEIESSENPVLMWVKFKGI